MKKIFLTTAYVLVLSLIFPAVGFCQFQFEKTESRGDVSPVFHTGDESGEWLRWDEGINDNAIGLTSPGWWTSAIRFDTDDLAPYDGWWVTKFLIYQQDLAADVIMKLWQGPDINNLTEHVSQSFEQQEESWIEVELYEPYIIDAGKELVFGIEWNDFGSGYFSAGVESIHSHPYKGDLLMLGTYPGTWGYLSDFNMWGWNHAIWVTDDPPPPEYYLLELFADPEDGGTVDGAGEYTEGEEVEISAEAGEGWEFIEWTGDTEHVDDPGQATATVTMPADDIELTANFEMADYHLTLEVYPEEGGTVTGEGMYNMGEEVEIFAEAGEGWEFIEWIGDTEHVDDPTSANATVTMPAEDIELTANFEMTDYHLTLEANPGEGGTVKGGGMYNMGEEAEISAESSEGWNFTEWTGDTDHVDDPTSATATVTMPAKDVTLTAEFDDKVAVKNIIDAEVKIFPNPARDKFYVESSEIINKIRLINISGQVITDITVDELSTEINVSNLRPGVYFMQVHTKESVITERVQIVQ